MRWIEGTRPNAASKLQIRRLLASMMTFTGIPFRAVEAQNSGLDKQRYARLFSRTSKVHDSVGGLFAHFGSLLVERAELKPGDRVLDIAAGTGASLVPAAQRVGPTGRVVGVDLAPGMVDRLRDVIEAAQVGNAEALVADAEELPFRDDSFDAVLCGFGLFFFPDPLCALTEARRVLRAGGVVALSTFTRDGSASMDSIWQRIADHIPVPPPADDEVRFHEPAQLLGALAAAGFLGAESDVAPFDVVLANVDAWLGWLRSMEFGQYVERMGPARLERFRRAAEAEFAGETGAPQIRFKMDALLTRARTVNETVA
jgi:ubiquinone/menaquinone biosynthesis C-methylase UbiE